MGLMQPSEHIIHDGPRCVHAVGLLNRRLQLVMDRLPIEPSRLGFAMLVAHRFPDILERIDVEAALFGSEREGTHRRGQNRGAKLRQRGSRRHSFSSTLAPSAPPSIGNAVRRIKSINRVTTIKPTSPAGSSRSLVMALNWSPRKCNWS